MSLRTILAEDKTLITFRPSLRRVLGSVKSVILFQQILYWYTHTGGKFYKFTSPCTHKLYKEGDSFSEETSLSAKEIRGALESFAFKCGKKNKDLYGDSYEETRDAAMVLYYTDSNRVTWYKLN